MYNIWPFHALPIILKVIGPIRLVPLYRCPIQFFLQGWIAQYTGQSSGEMTDDFIAKYPLAESSVVFRESPGNLGNYFARLISDPMSM